jgi:hypothetical protein
MVKNLSKSVWVAGRELKFGLILICSLTRINGYQCYVFRFCLRVFLIISEYFFEKCQELI